jgi:hypothetical protein
MKQVSNSDFYKALRLLYALSATRGETIREKENARKAFLLYRKLKKKDDKQNGITIGNTSKL